MKPKHLFLVGLLAIPSLLFQPLWYLRLLQMGCIFILNIIFKRKIKIQPAIILFTVITLSHLLIPSGKVLFYIHTFPISLGGLIEGLKKASLLIGLVYLSKLCITRGISFSGTAWGLLEQTLFYYEEIAARPFKFKRKTFFSDLDSLLFEVQESVQIKSSTPEKEGPGGIFWGILIPTLNWGLFTLGMFLGRL